MMNWIAQNQDFVLFSLMTVLAFLGYAIGSMCKKDEMKHLISDYESLLDLAYADKQNLMVALASIQGRQEGQYLGYRVAGEPKIFDAHCDCEFCDRLKNS